MTQQFVAQLSRACMRQRIPVSGAPTWHYNKDMLFQHIQLLQYVLEEIRDIMPSRVDLLVAPETGSAMLAAAVGARYSIPTYVIRRRKYQPMPEGRMNNVIVLYDVLSQNREKFVQQRLSEWGITPRATIAVVTEGKIDIPHIGLYSMEALYACR